MTTVVLPPAGAVPSTERWKEIVEFFDRHAGITVSVAPSAGADIAASLRALIAAREVLAEMEADDAVNAKAIEQARREGNRHYEHELIGAKRDTHAWRMKLRAIIDGSGT